MTDRQGSPDGAPAKMAGDDGGLTWSDAMLLGHGPIDAAHEEFVEVVTALAHSTQHTALDCLRAVEKHLLSHFEVERQWMEKTDFPAADCHLDEHQRVLDAVQKVTTLAASAAVGLSDVKRLAKALSDWFPGHADYMDSALSAWINKKTHGGAPVVLRRDLAIHESRVPEEAQAV
ncbi:Hemerythrin-like metal-binding protein [Paraburkholderia ribeironis]|uniref:Hemerythrin-like metal-binding protein n=1 Tax=Paraburkholderia ribeironis TaxID=1247936 RepID=A0A1N7SBC9_9BURK|nr:hemerythrin domain-containing protein [Paraburkholderia ribeironis]SIT44633.1 Hemerythrin-like metal-binding protein [Paraburkholderia ribeironis]